MEDDDNDNQHWEAVLSRAIIDDNSSSSNEAYHAIRMRQDILEQLLQQYRSGSLGSNNTENSMLCLRGIPVVYKMAMALSSYTNKLDKVRHHIHKHSSCSLKTLTPSTSLIS